ncbi:leucine Rich repeat-containing domain protein, partial [Trichinella nativa]
YVIIKAHCRVFKQRGQVHRDRHCPHDPVTSTVILRAALTNKIRKEGTTKFEMAVIDFCEYMDKEEQSAQVIDGRVDAKNNRFPLCLVWTPIPFISWLLPFIGHLGIALSTGVIHDFSTSGYVSEDHMAFGKPCRYYKCDLIMVLGKHQQWDRCVRMASNEYRSRQHNIFWDNCHSHVALALNLMPYGRNANWNMLKLCVLMFFKGRYCVGIFSALASTLDNLWLGYWWNFVRYLIADSPQLLNVIRERELCLQNARIHRIENLGTTMDTFETLNFSNNDIVKLENFPLLYRLQTLYMANNRISTVDDSFGASLPYLKTLVLTDNCLAELGELEPLSKLQRLEHLCLIGNPVTRVAHYRDFVIYKIPQVRVLDYKRVRLRERESANAFFTSSDGEEFLKNSVRKATFSMALAFDDESMTDITQEVEDSVESNRTAEQMEMIKEAIENVTSLEELEELKETLARNEVPNGKEKTDDQRRKLCHHISFNITAVSDKRFCFSLSSDKPKLRKEDYDLCQVQSLLLLPSIVTDDCCTFCGKNFCND